MMAVGVKSKFSTRVNPPLHEDWATSACDGRQLDS